MFSVTISLLFLLACRVAADLPSYFPRCDLHDPDLNNCITTATETLKPYIQKGIKEIEFPSLEPLFISNVSATVVTENLNYTMSVWNLMIQGLENYHIPEVRYDPDKKVFSGKFRLHDVSLESDYNINGTILSIVLEGTGKVHERFDAIHGTFEIHGELIRGDGTEYYKPTNTKIEMTIEGPYYHLDGLFNGDVQLGRVTNEKLNQKSKAITDAITPVFAKQVETGLMYLMTSLTRNVPYYELFHV